MICGAVESIEASRISGWVYSQENADDKLLIDVFDHVRLRGSTWASLPGPALSENTAWFGHWFVVELARPLEDTNLDHITVYATALTGERVPLEILPSATVDRVRIGSGADKIEIGSLTQADESFPETDETPTAPPDLPISPSGGRSEFSANSFVSGLCDLHREITVECAVSVNSMREIGIAVPSDGDRQQPSHEVILAEAGIMQEEVLAALERLKTAVAGADEAARIIGFTASELHEFCARYLGEPGEGQAGR